MGSTPKQKIVGLATVVAILGAGLTATLLYFLLSKKPEPCTPCQPCNCYAEAVGSWQQKVGEPQKTNLT